MDRREALKKPGVGTAIVAASPAVLPSFRVAHAASGGIGRTGLTGVPPQGAPIPWNRIYDPINWRAPGVQNWPAGSEVAGMPVVSSTFSGGGYGQLADASTYLLRVRFAWGEQAQLDGYIDGAITYALEARCRWHCPGASTEIVAEYRFRGQGRDNPSVTNISWDDQAPA